MPRNIYSLPITRILELFLLKIHGILQTLQSSTTSELPNTKQKQVMMIARCFTSMKLSFRNTNRAIFSKQGHGPVSLSASWPLLYNCCQVQDTVQAEAQRNQGSTNTRNQQDAHLKHGGSRARRRSQMQELLAHLPQ